MKFFKPNYQFEHFSDISILFLQQHNIQFIFSDLDSTLAAHDQLGDDKFVQWYNELKNHHIKVIIVSNNNQQRVDRFTKQYDMLGYGKVNKPTTKKIEAIMKELGATSSNSIFLGDQLLTDVWCGKRLNMMTILVDAIGPEHEPWNVRLKRSFEEIAKKRW